jgi:hypothetical protein
MARLAAVLAVFDAAVFLNEFPHHGGLELTHRFLVAIDARSAPGVTGLLLGVCHPRRNEQHQRNGEPSQVSHMSHRLESSAGPAIPGGGQLVIRLLTSP